LVDEILSFDNGIPKHDTFARVLSRLNPVNIQTYFIAWVNEIDSADIISIAGKTARRLFSAKEQYKALHMVSVWSCGRGLVLDQKK
jgi:hypothetical protein